MVSPHLLRPEKLRCCRAENVGNSFVPFPCGTEPRIHKRHLSISQSPLCTPLLYPAYPIHKALERHAVMADPLSIAASMVGVTVPALEGTRLLINILDQIKDAPKTVTRLSEDVRSVDTALSLLQGVEDQDWKSLGITVAEKSKTAISNYQKACDLFTADLRQWTRHSEDGRLTWQDRANIGFWKKAQVKAMSDQLQNCKLSINSVVSIAILYVASQSHR